MTDLQQLIKDAREEMLYIKDRILESKDGCVEQWEKRDWIIAMEKTVKIETALDQLSAYLAEQEKAVRVKVLEDLKNLVDKLPRYTETAMDFVKVFKSIIDQKIEEAKK